MAEIPFIGPSYNLLSRPSGVQRTVNLVPLPQEPGNERTAWVFEDVPGLESFNELNESPDPLFDKVILLMTGTVPGGFVDASSYAWAMGGTGATFSTDMTLFGNPMYKLATTTQRVTVVDTWLNDPTFISTKEFCYESWVYFTAAGSSNNWCYMGVMNGIFDGSNLGMSFAIGGSTITVGSAISLNTLYHVVWVRDNTSDPTFAYIRMYINGVLVASSASFLKSAIFASGGVGAAGFEQAYGYFTVGPTGYFIEGRFTLDDRRYTGNFSVPTAPFPTFGP